MNELVFFLQMKNIFCFCSGLKTFFKFLLERQRERAEHPHPLVHPQMLHNSQAELGMEPEVRTLSSSPTNPGQSRTQLLEPSQLPLRVCLDKQKPNPHTPMWDAGLLTARLNACS